MKRIFPIVLLVAVAMVMPAMASPATAHTPVNLLDSDTTPSAGPLLVDGTVSFAIRASFTKSGQKKAFRAALKKGEELVVEYLIVDKKPENAFKHVAGYFVGLDFTNRILQGVNKKSGADWVLAKGTNQFAAVSEYVHKSAVVDPSNIDVKLTINGETRQSSNTKMMIFDMQTMIADISKYQELREGDIIFTGTPEGVGAVKDGDNLVCTIRNGGDEIDLATLNIKVAYQ